MFHKHRFELGIVIVALICAAASPVVPLKAQPTTPTPLILNVRDFGAIGDGEADDTAALAACASALASSVVRIQPAGGSGEAAYPSVLFPAGHYKISGPINWGGYAHLVADGSVIIKPIAPMPVFNFAAGYMVHLEGFTFLNAGINAVRFTNNNVNGARLHVDRCRFQFCTSAIHAGPESGNYFSSQVTISNCKFHQCKQSLLSWADLNTMRDCWIQWSQQCSMPTDKCIEIRGGRINLADSMFVPVFPDGAMMRRWIGWTGFPERNGGSGIFCDRVLFHGEFGGLPPIEIASPPDLHYPFQGPQVVLRGCQLSCGQTSWFDCAVINCVGGGLPQTVYLDASSSVIGPCPLIRDLGGTEAAFNSLENGPNRVRIMVGANTFYPLNPPVPSFLQPYVRNLAL